jgi:PAS domain S-box-containing protein
MASQYPPSLCENRPVSDQIENLADPRVQQLLLAEALDTAPLLVFVADEQMRYVAVNQTACDVLGYTRSELLRLRVTDVAAAPEAGGLYDAMLRTRRQEGSTPIRARDGRLIPFFYNARSATVAGMHYFVSVGFVEEQLPPALRDLLSSPRPSE